MRSTRTVFDLLDPPCPEEATRGARPGFALNSRAFAELTALFDAFTRPEEPTPRARCRRRLKRLFRTCNEPVRKIEVGAISCETVLKWVHDANDWHPVVRFELCRALDLAHRLHGPYKHQNFFPVGDREAVLKACCDGIVAVHFRKEPRHRLSFRLHYPIEETAADSTRLNDPYYYWDEWAVVGIREHPEAGLPMAPYLPEEHATPRRYDRRYHPGVRQEKLRVRRLAGRRLPDGALCFSYAFNPFLDYEPSPYRVQGTGFQEIELVRLYQREAPELYYRTFASPTRPLVLRTDDEESEPSKTYFGNLKEVALDLGWTVDQLTNPRWFFAALRRERLSSQFVLVQWESDVPSLMRKEFLRIPRRAEIRAELRRLHQEISAAANAPGGDALEQPTHGMLRAALRRNHDDVVRLP